MATVATVRPIRPSAAPVLPVAAPAFAVPLARPGATKTGHAVPAARRKPTVPVLAPREVATALPAKPLVEAGVDGNATLARGRAIAIGAYVAQDVGEKVTSAAAVVDALAKPAKPMADPVAVLLHVAAVAATGPGFRGPLGGPLPLRPARVLAIIVVEASGPAVGPAVPTGALVGERNAREALALRPVPEARRTFAAVPKLKACRAPMGAPALLPAAALHEAAASSPQAMDPTLLRHLPAIQARPLARTITEGLTLLPPRLPTGLASLGPIRPGAGEVGPVIRRVQVAQPRVGPVRLLYALDVLIASGLAATRVGPPVLGLQVPRRVLAAA